MTPNRQSPLLRLRQQSPLLDLLILLVRDTLWTSLDLINVTNSPLWAGTVKDLLPRLPADEAGLMMRTPLQPFPVHLTLWMLIFQGHQSLPANKEGCTLIGKRL